MAILGVGRRRHSMFIGVGARPLFSFRTAILVSLLLRGQDSCHRGIGIAQLLFALVHIRLNLLAKSGPLLLDRMDDVLRSGKIQKWDFFTLRERASLMSMGSSSIQHVSSCFGEVDKSA
jgi:hypothetical protein